MWNYHRDKIKLSELSKALIVLGDSFVEGQGALTDYVWNKYDWSEEKFNGIGHQTDGKPNKEHEYIRTQERNNAFPAVICREYMKDWTPINLGFRGNGNRGPVKALTTCYPDLNLHLPKEKIVIFFVGQFCRFDFVSKEFDSHAMWHTIWPHADPGNNASIGIRKLWNGYATEIYNDLTGIIEFMMLVKEVEMWCKLHNAKLVLINSFEYNFSKEVFKEVTKHHPYAQLLVNNFPWDNVMKFPKGLKAMVDYLLDGEDKLELNRGGHGFYFWAKSFKKGTPNGYFTPCAHPTIKGHELYAKVIYEHLKNNVL